MVKNPPVNAGDIRDLGSIPGSRGSLGGGHGNPLQYCCLEDPMDREARRAPVHRVAKSQIWLSTHVHTKWISYMYTYIPSPLDLPLTPPSMPPVLVTTGTKLSFLSYIAGFHSILQMIVIWFLCILFPAFPSPPKLYTISQPQTIPEINKDCVKPRSSKFSSKTEQMHQRTSGYMGGCCNK